ncbi:MAG: hypothetical protein ABH878_06865, partial [bacterium]
GEFRKLGEYWSYGFKESVKKIEVIKTIRNEEKFIELVKDAFEFTKHIEIYLCPIEGNDMNVRLIERNLLFDLKPEGTIPGTKSEPSERCLIVHKNAKWASEQVRGQIRKEVVII